MLNSPTDPPIVNYRGTIPFLAPARLRNVRDRWGWKHVYIYISARRYLYRASKTRGNRLGYLYNSTRYPSVVITDYHWLGRGDRPRNRCCDRNKYRVGVLIVAVITIPLLYNVITLNTVHEATYSPGRGTISIRGNIAGATG